MENTQGWVEIMLLISETHILVDLNYALAKLQITTWYLFFEQLFSILKCLFI